MIFRVLNLYYKKGLTYSEIGKRYNLSRVKVFRIVKEARENNLVTININDPEENLRKLERQIEDKYKIRECIIVSSDRDSIIYKKIAKATELFLDMKIEKNMNIGVGWGKTLRAFSRNLGNKGDFNINVIPLTGGLGHIDDGTNTNIITNLIAKAYSGKNYLINFQGIVVDEKLKKSILEDRSLKDIFNRFNRIDIAIVGLSGVGVSATNLIDFGYVERGDYFKLNELGIVGDINLNFIDAYGNEVDNFLKDRIINAGLDVLKKIDTIVVPAFGIYKAKTILAALRGKLLSVLITDEATIKKVLELDDGKKVIANDIKTNKK